MHAEDRRDGAEHAEGVPVRQRIGEPSLGLRIRRGVQNVGGQL